MPTEKANPFTLSDAEIQRHIKRQNGNSVVNKKLRGEGVSFFQAMMSEEADYIKQGVVAESDLRNAFADEGE